MIVMIALAFLDGDSIHATNSWIMNTCTIARSNTTGTDACIHRRGLPS